MRVIAGEAKGRKLITVDAPGLRPTGDKLKGAMFSSLGAAVVDERVLDLYAGSGALGIEALSRGAAHAVFVDEDLDAVSVISKNLAHTGLADRSEVVASQVEFFLQQPNKEPFMLVLMDPPYAVGIPSDMLGSLRVNGYVIEGSRVVIEVSSKLLPIEGVPGYQITNEKKYGGSALIYLRATGGE